MRRNLLFDDTGVSPAHGIPALKPDARDSLIGATDICRRASTTLSARTNSSIKKQQSESFENAGVPPARHCLALKQEMPSIANRHKRIIRLQLGASLPSDAPVVLIPNGSRSRNDSFLPFDSADAPSAHRGLSLKPDASRCTPLTGTSSDSGRPEVYTRSRRLLPIASSRNGTMPTHTV